MFLLVLLLNFVLVWWHEEANIFSNFQFKMLQLFPFFIKLNQNVGGGPLKEPSYPRHQITSYVPGYNFRVGCITDGVCVESLSQGKGL